MIAAFMTVFILISHYAEDRRAFLAYQRDVRAHPILHGHTLSLNRDYPPEFNLAVSDRRPRLAPGLSPFHRVILGRGRAQEPRNDQIRRALRSCPRSTEVPPACIRRDAELAAATLVEYGCK